MICGNQTGRFSYVQEGQTNDFEIIMIEIRV
jgi:hypothetical protein